MHYNASEVLLSCRSSLQVGADKEVTGLSAPPCWWSGVTWLRSQRFCGMRIANCTFYFDLHRRHDSSSRCCTALSKRDTERVSSEED